MFRIIYASNATSTLGSLEMSQLVAMGSAHNAGQNISSFLVRLNGNFLQVLEGEPRRVSDLMDRIWDDPRHENIDIMVSDVDSEAHRPSRDHPLTFIDYTNGYATEAERLSKVRAGWQALREMHSQVDTWFAQYDSYAAQVFNGSTRFD